MGPILYVGVLTNERAIRHHKHWHVKCTYESYLILSIDHCKFKRSYICPSRIGYDTGIDCVLGEGRMSLLFLENLMGVDQRTGKGSKPLIPRVVSKSDRDHGTATMAHRTLGLTPAGTVCHRNLSLSLYLFPLMVSFLSDDYMGVWLKV